MQILFRLSTNPLIIPKNTRLINISRTFCLALLLSGIFSTLLLWSTMSQAGETKQNKALNATALAPLSVQDALKEIIKQATVAPRIAQGSSKKNKIIKKGQNPPTPSQAKNMAKPVSVLDICKKIGAKLGSVSKEDCLSHNFILGGGHSRNGLPIIVKEYPPLKSRTPQARILLLGGIHGDEFSSVSIVFKWMKTLNQHHSGLFHWRVVPLVNPDGLLQRKSQRMNHNKVDLNRNFPTAATHQEWLEQSRKYWVDETKSDPRRYPGPGPLSEPESRWVTEEIERFKPHAVVSVHAPFGLLDFDGPPNIPPEKLGQLYLSLLGTYPGSLGRYVGSVQRVPIITIELEHAGIMPSKKEVNSIWKDLVRWLAGHVRGRQRADSNLIENLLVDKPLNTNKNPIAKKTSPGTE
jgi:murein peptide amidase A